MVDDSSGSVVRAGVIHTTKGATQLTTLQELEDALQSIISQGVTSAAIEQANGVGTPGGSYKLGAAYGAMIIILRRANIEPEIVTPRSLRVIIKSNSKAETKQRVLDKCPDMESLLGSVDKPQRHHAYDAAAIALFVR